MSLRAKQCPPFIPATPHCCVLKLNRTTMFLRPDDGTSMSQWLQNCPMATSRLGLFNPPMTQPHLSPPLPLKYQVLPPLHSLSPLALPSAVLFAALGSVAVCSTCYAEYLERHPQCLRWEYHIGHGFWVAYPDAVQRAIAAALSERRGGMTVHLGGGCALLNFGTMLHSMGRKENTYCKTGGGGP